MTKGQKTIVLIARRGYAYKGYMKEIKGMFHLVKIASAFYFHELFENHQEMLDEDLFKAIVEKEKEYSNPA